MKTIIDALQWRYATQLFDPQKKLTPAQLTTLTEAMRLSASSFGLQPWKFIVVTNPAIRTKLREAAYNQPKVTDASHFIVLAVQKNVDAAFVDKYIASTAKIRGLKVADLKGLEGVLKGSIASRTPEAAKEWASRQVYIALGTLLAAAAVEGIDAGPMEGFDPKKFDEILELNALGLESRVAAAVGFRSEGDTASKLIKSRFSREEVIIEVK
jgi:nitroreductase